jgi:hypothetical protein
MENVYNDCWYINVCRGSTILFPMWDSVQMYKTMLNGINQMEVVLWNCTMDFDGFLKGSFKE